MGILWKNKQIYAWQLTNRGLRNRRKKVQAGAELCQGQFKQWLPSKLTSLLLSQPAYFKPSQLVSFDMHSER